MSETAQAPTQNQEQPEEPTPQRDEKGRFVENNLGGPGNPYARQTAKFRAAIHSALTDEDFQQLTRKLLAMSLEGNLEAAKLLLSYSIGKPVANPHPDKMVQDEWQNLQFDAQLFKESATVASVPHPEVSLVLVRTTREGASQRLSQGVLDGIAELDRRDAARAEAPKASPPPPVDPDPAPMPDLSIPPVERSVEEEIEYIREMERFLNYMDRGCPSSESGIQPPSTNRKKPKAKRAKKPKAKNRLGGFFSRAWRFVRGNSSEN